MSIFPEEKPMTFIGAMTNTVDDVGMGQTSQQLGFTLQALDFSTHAGHWSRGQMPTRARTTSA
jgi:hypothetical protein